MTGVGHDRRRLLRASLAGALGAGLGTVGGVSPAEAADRAPREDGSGGGATRVAVLLYDGFTALDAVGPYEVLCRLPEVTVTTVAEKAGLGDAAHMTPPFLAQGMCQGIRDASNLMWKLALHLRGGAGESLLDTYQREREPHVRQVTLTAKEFGHVICERDEATAAKRDRDLLAELAAKPEGTIRQSLIPGLRAGFLAPEGFPPRGDILPQPRVSDSQARSGLLDEFTGSAFRLVLRHDTDRAAAASALRAHQAEGGLPVHVVCLVDGAEPGGQDEYREESHVLDAWMRRQECAAVLARPDHYVFGGARSAREHRGRPPSRSEGWTSWSTTPGSPSTAGRRPRPTPTASAARTRRTSSGCSRSPTRSCPCCAAPRGRAS